MLDRTLPRPIHKSTGAFLCAAICKCLSLCAIFALGAAVAPAQTQTPAQTPFLFAGVSLTNTDQDSMVTLLRDPTYRHPDTFTCTGNGFPPSLPS